MCLSVQFYLLGSLHCSGIVFAVLGYMLVLHQYHNLFGDPIVMPLFLGVSMFLEFAKKFAMRVADRLQIWMVDSENEFEEVYDEGPNSRNRNALPPGMAAVDATLAECIEDAFAAGYTDETLAKVLTEATLYIPPGMSIQAAGAGGPSLPEVSTDLGQASVSQAQVADFLQLQAQGLLPSSQQHLLNKTSGSLLSGSTIGPTLTALGPTSGPGSSLLSGAVGCPMYAQGACGVAVGGNPFAGLGVMGGAAHFGTGDPAPGRLAYGPLPPAVQTGLPHQELRLAPEDLPPGIPPPPSSGKGGKGMAADIGESAFSDFMAAFRVEMRAAREHNARVQKFVPSSKLWNQEEAGILSRANDVFSVEMAEPGAMASHAAGNEDFDEWPDVRFGTFDHTCSCPFDIDATAT